MFVLAIPLIGVYHKTEEYTGYGCSLKKIQLELIRNLWNRNATTKKRSTELLWARVLKFLQQEKMGRRSKAQRSCNFLSKEPLSKRTTDTNEIHRCIFNLNLYSFAKWYVIVFKFNFCASHTTTRSLPKNWRIYRFRLFF